MCNIEILIKTVLKNSRRFSIIIEVKHMLNNDICDVIDGTMKECTGKCTCFTSEYSHNGSVSIKLNKA